MDGRNCTGRTISLLNDSSDTAAVPSKVQLPPLTAHSRTSSCASTPSLSPQTPQLSRSSSSDSRGLASPSPLTPSLATFDSLARHHLQRQPQHQHQHQQYFIPSHSYAKMDDQAASMYPPIPDATAAMNAVYPMQPQMPLGMHLAPQQPLQQQQQQQQQNPQQMMQRSSTSPHSEPSRASNASAASNAKAAPPKKNQYPCPMAKQMGCSDFFTTSGHAARHAKKHTGKKDAFCPECNKAFTRKDNMEQHRRTHQNGRGMSRTADDNKVKKPAKPQQTKKSSGVKNEAQLEAAVEQQFAEQRAQQAQADQIQASQAQPVMPLQATMPPPMQQQAAEQAMMMPTTTPYFLNGLTDPGPIPSLPLAPDLSIRPPLHRSNFNNSLDYVPPAAPMMLAHPDDLHYSYPSPGLSNGLNSLALAASEHRRMSEEKSRSESSRSPANESPSQETL